MEQKLKEQLKKEWNGWGDDKPWYCPKCDILLNKDFFPECHGGSHPYKPVIGHVPYHEPIKAERSVTFEEFCTIMRRYHR